MARAVTALSLAALISAPVLFAQTDSIYVTIIGDTVRAWDINIQENCASRFAVTVQRGGYGAYTVTERDTIGPGANCICTYFISVLLPEISVGGVYTVRFYREYLTPNYPNPFNPTTVIRYTLPHRAPVTLSVYNTLGQFVARLVNDTEEAGDHSVRFDGTSLASGVYICRMQAGSFVQSRKLILVQ